MKDNLRRIAAEPQIAQTCLPPVQFIQIVGAVLCPQTCNTTASEQMKRPACGRAVRPLGWANLMKSFVYQHMNYINTLLISRIVTAI